MPYFQSTYHSTVYRNFKEIEGNDYRRIIRFYEEKENEIKQLDFDEQFELLVTYVNALFEIGKYKKHLVMVDLVIEASIQQNIKHFRGEDIFQKMLFKKAASLYNTLQYDRADYILRELIRINPYDGDTGQFLKKCLRSQTPEYVKQTRAVSIFLFLLTAFVIGIEVLFVRPFYGMHADLIETSRISIFLLGCLMLIGGDFFHRWMVEREVDRFIAENRKSRRFD